MPYFTSSCVLSVESDLPEISCFWRTSTCFGSMTEVAHSETSLGAMVETPLSALLAIVRATLGTTPGFVRNIWSIVWRIIWTATPTHVCLPDPSRFRKKNVST